MLYVIDILSLAKDNKRCENRALLAQNFGINIAGGGYTFEQCPVPGPDASNNISL